MADKVVLVMAEADGRPVGGALNLKGDDTLYGRYWGCLESHAFLHFEACYYQAIDYAIAHGLQRVEAGAQGDHKIQRGYLPVPTFSAHWIVDRRLPPRRRQLPQAGAPGRRAGDRGADGVLAVQEGERVAARGRARLPSSLLDLTYWRAAVAHLWLQRMRVGEHDHEQLPEQLGDAADRDELLAGVQAVVSDIGLSLRQ